MLTFRLYTLYIVFIYIYFLFPCKKGKKKAFITYSLFIVLKKGKVSIN